MPIEEFVPLEGECRRFGRCGAQKPKLTEGKRIGPLPLARFRRLEIAVFVDIVLYEAHANALRTGDFLHRLGAQKRGRYLNIDDVATRRRLDMCDRQAAPIVTHRVDRDDATVCRDGKGVDVGIDFVAIGRLIVGFFVFRLPRLRRVAVDLKGGRQIEPNFDVVDRLKRHRFATHRRLRSSDVVRHVVDHRA